MPGGRRYGRSLRHRRNVLSFSDAILLLKTGMRLGRVVENKDFLRVHWLRRLLLGYLSLQAQIKFSDHSLGMGRGYRVEEESIIYNFQLSKPNTIDMSTQTMYNLFFDMMRRLIAVLPFNTASEILFVFSKHFFRKKVCEGCSLFVLICT